MAVPERLRKVLACPKCKGKITEEKMFLTCTKCRLAYPILDGKVPDMLIEDAWALDKARKAGFRHEESL